MDLARAEALYRNLVADVMPADVLLAHHLAYVRTGASPRIARLLAHTGHVEHAPAKRATDTGLLVYELIHHGLDSVQGDQVIASLNRMHGRWSIRNDDFLWVLGTFVVPSTRFLDRFAWRRVSGEEREATAAWFHAMGERMGLHDVPVGYQDFEAFVDDYEDRELAPTPEARRLFNASLPMTETMVPPALRRWSRQLFAVLVDEPARSALALPVPNRGLAATVTTAMLARSMAAHARPVPVFVSGGAYGPYTDGYAIEDLGVGDVAVLRPGPQVRAAS